MKLQIEEVNESHIGKIFNCINHPAQLKSIYGPIGTQYGEVVSRNGNYVCDTKRKHTNALGETFSEASIIVTHVITYND